MYRIKDKWKAHIAKYAHTTLNIDGVYNFETWQRHGFQKSVLQLVTVKA
jgi:hypothetical protein